MHVSWIYRYGKRVLGLELRIETGNVYKIGKDLRAYKAEICTNIDAMNTSNYAIEDVDDDVNSVIERQSEDVKNTDIDFMEN